MKKYKKLIEKINEDDWDIAIASNDIRLRNRLRKLYPMKNIFLTSSLSFSENEKNSTHYSLIVSKHNIHKFRKEDWKKIIVYY